METEITLDEMITELGGTPSATLETPPAETPAETDTPDTSTAQTPPETPPTTDPQTTDPKPDRTQQAFAAMRVQNKKYNDTLKGVANVLGIDPNVVGDEAKLLAALQEKIVATQAQQQNVPVELLTRLQQLEERDRTYTAEQRKSEAAVGFQRVQETFKLTQPQLNSFAEELIQNGINPLEQSTDLIKQYKLFHYDELIQQAEQRAIAAEQARAAKASSQATTPNGKQGAGSTGESAKVNSVHALEAWLEANVKK